MDAHYLLEWPFSPPDFFEARREVSTPTWKAVFGIGRVELRIEAKDYPADHSLRDRLHHDVDSHFKALQVLTHKQYELSEPNVVRVDADGRKHRTVFAGCASFGIVAHAPDVVMTDAAGNVIRDTRQERINRQNQFADLAVKHATDTVAASLLQSYSGAVNDPDNELVHLYEVRDAIRDFFGGDSAARDALGVSRNEWSRLGQLCNDAPLRQGRHRGLNVGDLHDATQVELDEARAITRIMIERYLEYMDNRSV